MISWLETLKQYCTMPGKINNLLHLQMSIHSVTRCWSEHHFNLFQTFDPSDFYLMIKNIMMMIMMMMMNSTFTNCKINTPLTSQTRPQTPDIKMLTLCSPAAWTRHHLVTSSTFVVATITWEMPRLSTLITARITVEHSMSSAFPSTW